MRLSFRSKTIIGIAVIESVLLVILILSSLQILKHSNEAEFERRAETIGKLFTATAKDAVISTDLATLEALAKDILNTPGIVYVRVSNNKTLLTQMGDEKNLSKKFIADDDITKISDSVYDIKYSISESGYTFGSVEIGISIEQLNQIMLSAKKNTISIAVIEVLLVALFSFVLGTYLTNQLKRLQKATKKVSSGEPGYQLPEEGNDDLSQTIKSFNEMSRRLKNTYDEIQTSLDNENIKSQELTTIMRAIPEGIVRMDKNGQILSTNPALISILNSEEAKLEGKNIHLYIPNMMSFRTDINNICDPSSEDIEFNQVNETIGVREDGSEFPAEVFAKKVRSGDDDLYIGMIRDVTESKLAQKRILGLSKFPAENPNPVFRLDMNFNTLYANKKGKDLLLRWNDYYDEDISDYLTKHFGDKIKNFQKFSLEINYPDRQYVSTVVPIEEERYINFYVADVTQIKEYQTELKIAKEIAVEANEEKSKFLATMSHELRTPMNAVLGVFSLLNDTALTESQLKLVDTGLQSGKGLLATINEVLDFSKIEAGMLTLDSELFDVEQVIQDAINIVSIKAYEKDIELAYCISNHIFKQYKGDAVRLKQVLLNIIGNAVKFTNSGGVFVNVSLDSETNTTALLRFEVMDTGEGIDEEDKSILFQEFTRLDNSTTRTHEGTGLGLAISKKLVEKMNGIIGVDSEAGSGSKFWFTCELGISQDCEKEFTPLLGKALFLSTNPIMRKYGEEYFNSIGLHSEIPVMTNIEEYLSKLNMDLFLENRNFIVIDDSGNPDFKKIEIILKGNEKNIENNCLWLIKSKNVNQFTQSSLLESSIILDKPIKNSTVYQILSLKERNTENVEKIMHSVASKDDEADKYQIDRDYRVLLVEDSEANVIVAQTMLENDGYKVDVARDGYEAVNAVKNQSYDVILMDMMMPVMDGLDATKNIRSMGGKLSTIPIIAMTANATKEDREKCISAGMNDFVTKPIDRVTLYTSFAKFVDFRIQQNTHAKRISNSVEDQSILIDEEVIHKLEDDTSRELMPNMISIFLEELNRRSSKIREGVDNRGVEIIASESHALKSSASTFGATKIANLSIEIDQLCKEGSIDKAIEKSDELLTFVAPTAQLYTKKYLSNGSF